MSFRIGLLELNIFFLRIYFLFLLTCKASNSGVTPLVIYQLKLIRIKNVLTQIFIFWHFKERADSFYANVNGFEEHQYNAYKLKGSRPGLQRSCEMWAMRLYMQFDSSFTSRKLAALERRCLLFTRPHEFIIYNDILEHILRLF